MDLQTYGTQTNQNNYLKERAKTPTITVIQIKTQRL